jgi:hypothetical protein
MLVDKHRRFAPRTTRRKTSRRGNRRAVKVMRIATGEETEELEQTPASVTRRGVALFFTMVILGPPIASSAYYGLTLRLHASQYWFEWPMIWFVLSNGPIGVLLSYVFAGPWPLVAGLVSCGSARLLPTAAARMAAAGLSGLICSLAGSYCSLTLAHLDRAALVLAGGTAALACCAMVEKICALSAMTATSEHNPLVTPSDGK